MLFGVVAIEGTRVAAQDATSTEGAPPITVETLGSAPSIDVAGMMQLLLQFTIAPGGVVPPHVHPGQLIVMVESGTLALTVLGGEGEVLRGGVATPTASEVVSPGAESMFGPGQWWVEDPTAVHTAVNTGDEPAVVLVSGLVAADEPFLQPMDMTMATRPPKSSVHAGGLGLLPALALCGDIQLIRKGCF